MQPMNNSFDIQSRVRLVYGNGVLARIGDLSVEIGAKRIFLVTDPGIVAAGHCARAMEYLQTAGLDVTVFEQVVENPTTECVRSAADAAKDAKVDMIVGLGGGSSMDAAKGCNFLLTNGGQMRDYWGVGKAKKPMLPLIAVPTTAGTGSECQSFALISDAETHVKMACGDPKAAATIAILDPELTLTQPPQVTACTGVDALAHAVETAVTQKRTPYSWLFSRESFRLIQKNIIRVLNEPSDLEARGAMLLGAAYAGIAIESSMLGAAHALANPLTANHSVIHGQAVGMMLPHVVRYNGAEPRIAAIYRELAAFAGLTAFDATAEQAVECVARRIEEILEAANMPRCLPAFNVVLTQLPTLAQEAAQQWTGTFNPRVLDHSDFVSLYRQAMTVDSLRPVQ